VIGVIGGTGLGEALFGSAEGKDHDVDTPFGRPSTPIRVVPWHGVEVALLARHGNGHVFNPAQVPYRANIYALKSLGVTHVIASGAVGSLREEIRPRDLVLVDQIIDKTTRRTPTFFDEGLAVHVEFAEPFCPCMRDLLCAAADKIAATVHRKGTYVCMEGPAFSSIAESRLHREWGGDVIGMTAMPEAKLAREAELSYGLVALATDFDCWKPHEPGRNRQELLTEIIGNLKDATANAVDLIRVAVELFAAMPPAPCPVHSGLDLAIWTDRAKITATIARRYGVLLERYLQAGAPA
jgi:5'-methylthioadenosine phosphorylase